VQEARKNVDRRILVVDDEPDLLITLTEWLKSRGYSVIDAANGQEALARVSEHASFINLLITDVNMPQISGLELARRVRQEVPDLKVIFMSGYEPSQSLNRAKLIGSKDTTIGKPFALDELEETIDLMIGN
jgi:two-component system, cell cycle sensor histidine kinase and response regulator CckA